MKRILTACLCVAIILTSAMLTACSDKKGGSGKYFLTIQQSIYDNGMFYHNIDGCVHFLDFENCIDVVICGKPNCTHSDDSCSARGFRVTPYILYGDNLYWFVKTSVYSEDMTHIDIGTLNKCDMNGTNRTEVFELPIDCCAEDTSMFLDGDILYFIARNYFEGTSRKGIKEKQLLYSYDFKSGELTELLKICDLYKSNANIEGIYDGKMYMRYQGFDEYITELTSDDYEKVIRYFYYDLKDKTIHPIENKCFCIEEGYFVTESPDGLLITAEDGYSIVADKFEPIEYPLCCDIINGKLINWWSISAFDIRSGEYYELKTRAPIAYRNGKYIVPCYEFNEPGGVSTKEWYEFCTEDEVFGDKLY